MQFVIERYHFTVHFCTDRLIADFAMDAVGKIDRARAVWHFDDVAFWGEHVYHVRKQIEFQRFHEFFRIVGFVLEIKDFAEPRQA